MPPPLALLLCIIFVVFLLRLEHKQGFSVSNSLWIPTIWFLYSSSKSLGMWFGGGASDIESGSPIDRAFLIALLLCGLLILLRKMPEWSNPFKENIWVLVLLGYMLISILWSDIPGISLRRWTRELNAVVMAFLIFAEQDPRQALQSILRRSIYILIPFSIVLSKYFPAYGVEFSNWSGRLMWIGVAAQKNSLAQLCISSFLFLIWTLIRRWKGRDLPVVKYQTHIEVLLLFLTLLLFAGPQKSLFYSSTSTAAIAVGLITMMGLFLIKKRGLSLGVNTLKIMAISIIAYGTYTPFAGRLRFLDISSAFGRDATLTGRSVIWSILRPFAERRPFLGYGVGGFWTTAMRKLTSSHAHNGYLDIILALGFVGLIIVSMYLLSCCSKAHRSLVDDHDWGTLFISFFVMVLVHNIAEPSLDTLASHLSAIILFFFVSSKKYLSNREP